MFNKMKRFLVGEEAAELFVPKDREVSVLSELRALRREVAELRKSAGVSSKATVDMEKRQRRWYRDHQGGEGV